MLMMTVTMHYAYDDFPRQAYDPLREISIFWVVACEFDDADDDDDRVIIMMESRLKHPTELALFRLRGSLR